jgi:DNA-binding transcriptional regulator GbsR (MarR family)
MMAKRKLTKAEIEKHKAFREQMQRNIDRTRRLAEKAQAELDAKNEREQRAS